MANGSSQPRHPGCFIGITGLIVFSLLATWAVYTGYKQNKAISRFTQSEQADLGVTYRDRDTIFDLKTRVRAFGKEVRAGKSATIEFSPADINDLIGHEKREGMEDLRKMIAIGEIGETVRARVALPMQTLFQGGKLRYLNGYMEFKPKIEDNQAMLEIVKIEPDKGGEVPEGFFNFISGNVNLLGMFRDDYYIGGVLEKLSALEIVDGKLRAVSSGS